MTRSLRLPDRSTTDNVEKFEKEWDAYCIPLERKLDVRVTSFDPGFTVVDKNDQAWSAHIPMWLAERILRI